MMSNILDGEEGVTTGGRKIDFLRFADNMVILADETAITQRILQKLEDGVAEYGMKINVGKISKSK